MLKKELIFLVILVISSLLLRGLQLYKFAPFDFDEGRDLLVGRHLGIYHEILTTGHEISGHQSLYYPPYYYYFLAAIFSVLDSYYPIIFIFFFLSLLTVPLIYFTAKNLFNFPTGMAASIIWLFNPVGLTSVNIWSLHLGLFLYILSLYFFSLSIKYSHQRYYWLSLVTTTSASLINLEFIIGLIIIIFWHYSDICFPRSKPLTKQHFIVPLSLLFFISFNFIIFNRYPMREPAFLHTFWINSKQLFFTNLSNIYTDLSNLFGDLKSTNLLILILLFIPLIFRHLLLPSLKPKYYRSLLLILMLIGICLLISFKNYLAWHYLYVLIPPIIIVLGFVLSLISRNSLTLSLILSLTISLYLNQITLSSLFARQVISQPNAIISASLVSSNIAQDYLANRFEFLPQIYSASNEANSIQDNPLSIIFFLEKNISRQIISLDEFQVFNNNAFNHPLTPIYLICYDSQDNNAVCFSEFINKTQLNFNIAWQKTLSNQATIYRLSLLY